MNSLLEYYHHILNVIYSLCVYVSGP